MIKFSKKRQLMLPLSLLGLFFLLFALPLDASDCQVVFNASNTTSVVNNEIEKEIQSYFKNHSLHPVLTDQDIEYEINYMTQESGTVYALGYLSQGGNCLVALFFIEQGWFSAGSGIIYMTTDYPHSPVLFRDICATARLALPQSLSKYHVFIQKLESHPNGEKVQVWSFYNQEEWINLIVTTVPTPDGGTDFVITRPPN